MSPGCTYPFLLRGRRPHVTGKTFGTRDDPCDATSTGSRISGLQSFADVQSPPLARPPGRTHREARRHRAAGPFTPRIARRVTPTGMWHRYVTDLGNCHGWTRTSWIPVLSAAPSRTRLSDKDARPAAVGRAAGRGTPPGGTEPFDGGDRLIATLPALGPLPAPSLNSGRFPPPALPGFAGTTNPSATPGSPACPSRASGCGPLPRTAWGFPCCLGSPLRACCRQYPGGTAGSVRS